MVGQLSEVTLCILACYEILPSFPSLTGASETVVTFDTLPITTESVVVGIESGLHKVQYVIHHACTL